MVELLFREMGGLGGGEGRSVVLIGVIGWRTDGGGRV
jgi:hypothetical protein